MTDLKNGLLTDKVYTKKEVASMLHVTNITIGNYIKDGKLQAVKVANGRVLIPETALKEFIDNYTEIK